MATSYPGGVDSFGAPAGTDSQSTPVGGRTHSQSHTDLGDAVEAIETELGVNPSGGSATVVARLDALDSTVAGKEAAGVAAALVDDLSGVSNAATARTNLGLGGAATLSVGTTAGTVAAGDDARIVGARPASDGGGVGLPVSMSGLYRGNWAGSAATIACSAGEAWAVPVWSPTARQIDRLFAYQAGGDGLGTVWISLVAPGTDGNPDATVCSGSWANTGYAVKYATVSGVQPAGWSYLVLSSTSAFSLSGYLCLSEVLPASTPGTTVMLRRTGVTSLPLSSWSGGWAWAGSPNSGVWPTCGVRIA